MPSMIAATRAGAVTPVRRSRRRRRSAPVGTARTSSTSPTPGIERLQKMRAKLIDLRPMLRRNGPRFQITRVSVTTYSTRASQILGPCRKSRPSVAAHSANKSDDIGELPSACANTMAKHSETAAVAKAT